MKRHCLQTALILVCAGPWTSRASGADLPADAHGAAGASVNRRVVASGPRGRAPVSLGLGTGYGYTEPVLGLDDRHHRLLGSLLGEAAIRPWLALGLRLDGRYDRHAFGDGRPIDDGWVGEPRIYARADRPVGAASSVGVRATLFFPGADAPSIDASAVSGELLAMASRLLGATTVSANLGYRLDRSGHSASNPELLAPGDRLSLGVSDFDAALLGAGAQHQLGRLALFGEVTWEVLLGQDAPAAGKWPLRLGAGARWQVSQGARVEVMAEASPSGRSAQGTGMPLTPVPPRLGVLAELVLALGGAAPARIVPAPTMNEALVPVVEVDVGSTELPREARIALRQRSGERLFTLGEDGRFTLTDVTPGPATVTASAPGFRPYSQTLALEGGKPLTLNLILERELPSGQIRGTVRSFDGRPLTANVRLQSRQAEASEAEAPTEKRSDGGAFTFDVPPGRYRVTIGSPGHEPQSRMVEVEENGVTVLNVDLRRER
jgi:hypothetical protein